MTEPGAPRVAVYLDFDNIVISRYDQIHLKLHATANAGHGRHEADLLALDPTDEELIAAARWSRTQDRSEEHAQVLRSGLGSLGLATTEGSRYQAKPLLSYNVSKAALNAVTA